MKTGACLKTPAAGMFSGRTLFERELGLARHENLPIGVSEGFQTRSTTPKIFFVINARMPNKKAYGIQIAKMCEAFIENGADVELIIPKTHASKGASMKDFYDLRVDVPTKILPGLDCYARGRIFFALSSLVFIITSSAYLVGKRIKGERACIYIVDMDTFSFAPLALLGMPCFAEMHDVKPRTLFNRMFFKRARIIATNAQIADDLTKIFGLNRSAIIIEPNGVDIALFDSSISQEAARAQINISLDAKVALYVGRFYHWKGLGALVDAVRELPKSFAIYAVGGSVEDFLRASGAKEIPDSLHVPGSQPIGDIPIWQRAADVLIITGTRGNEQSFKHTAPMKVFEYMASRRPVVAADTPALRSIINADEAMWYKADDAVDLARVIERAATSDTSALVERAYNRAAHHSWKLRAGRILSLIKGQ